MAKKIDYRQRTKKLFEKQSLMVISTASGKESLHTSTMLFATDDKFNICVAMHAETLRAHQLQTNPNASGVMWEIGDLYVQWRGVAKELHDTKQIDAWLGKLAKKAVSLENFWPPIFQFHGQDYALFVIKPVWLRAMDISQLTIRSSEPLTETLIGKSYDKKSPSR
jgi:hypothetical protein